jgi:hypothetical protein
LKLNGTHQLLVYYYYYFNILGSSVYTIKKNTEVLVVASKETGLKVIADNYVRGHVLRSECKMKYNIKINNDSFERAQQFKYLGKTLTYQNSIQEEIKSRLPSGNACYHSVQNLLSSSLLFKNTNIKIYRTIILPVSLYGCETWLLTLVEECMLRVFETRVLKRIFGPEEGRGKRGV